MMDDLVVGEWTIPGSEIDERFETSGGPGGQHANRSRTAVHLAFNVVNSSLPDDVRAKLAERVGALIESSSAESRSQFRNRALARRRLAEKILEALRESEPRRTTRPTRASKRRRLSDKRARSEVKRRRRRPDIE